MRFKTFENYEDPEEDIGKLILTYNDDSTTWFYIEDAITNGVLEEKLDLGAGDAIIEKIGNDCFNEEYMTQEELTNIIIEDFEGTLQKLFYHLIKIEFLNEYPTVDIEGVDEDGEEWSLYYEASEEAKHQNEIEQTGKKYNL